MKRLCAIVGTLLLVFLFSYDGLANEKKYPSLLWEITGNGLEKPSYLYGTMHVSRKIAFHLSDTFFMGLDNADIIALETNPNNWMDEYLGSDLLKMGYGSRGIYNFRNSSYSGLYRNAFTFKAPEKDKISGAIAYKSNLMNGMLYRKSRGMEDFEEQTFLDLFIYQAAKKQGKEVVGLENFKETWLLSVKSTLEVKADKDKKKKRVPWELRRNIYSKINDAYRRGDLDLLDSLETLTEPTVNYRRYMLDIRNRTMVNNIDSILQHKTMFIGVGAAHLPGDSGMIEMLRAEGYTLRPVDRTVTKSSRKKMQSLKAKKIAVDYHLERSDDGAFQMQMPGKMYVVPSMYGSLTYYYPEMTNGAVYSIQRMKTYGPFFGTTTNDYRLMLDSLLYEYVPGDIEEMEEKEVNGFKALDIHNTTSRGDDQRYRIVFTPLEIFYFKIRGTGENTKSKNKELDKVMQSIELAPMQEGWSNYTGPFGEFSFDLPNYRLVNDGNPKQKEISSFEAQGYDISDSSYYLFMNSTVNDFKYVEQDTFELDQFAAQFAEEMDLEMLGKQIGTYKGFPAIDATFENEDKEKVWAKFVIRGSEYYMLLAKADDKSKADRFLNSFKMLPYKYESEPKLFVDSMMLFSAKIIDGMDEDCFRAIIPRITYQAHLNYTDGEKGDRYDSDVKYMSVEALTTGERILVRAYRYGMFEHHDSIKHFYDAQERRLKTYNKLHILKTDTGHRDGMRYAEYVYGDSASSQVIRSRVLLNHTVAYTLTCLGDTISQNSKFVDTFFESFKPLADTVIPGDIFASKMELWKEYALGTDSLKREWAMDAIDDLDVEDYDVPKVIEVFTNFNYKHKDIEEKRAKEFKMDMLRAIAFNDHPDFLDFLKKVYADKDNSVELTYYVLKQIGEVETEAGHEFLREQMLIEPPLSDEDDAWDLMSSFTDSLELCPVFYPDFIELAEYPEYEGPVYHLLQLLVDSGMVSKDVYARKVNIWARKASSEVRRQKAAHEEKSSRRYYSNRYYSNTYSPGEYPKVEKDLHTYKTFKYRPKYIKLLNYAKLLVHHADNERVQSFVKSSLTLEDKDLLTELTVLYLEHDIAIPDTLLASLTKDWESRYTLFRTLEHADLLQHFDSAYMNHDSLIVSKLYKGNYNEEGDSVQFVERKLQSNKYGEGYVYIFKSKREKNDNWEYDVVYLVPKDSMDFDYSKVQFKNDFANLYAMGEKEKKEEYEKTLKKAMRNARCIDRKRASGYTNRYYY